LLPTGHRSSNLLDAWCEELAARITHLEDNFIKEGLQPMLNARLKRGAIAIPATVALVAATLTATAVQADAATTSALTALAGSMPSFAAPSADRGQVPTGAEQTTRIYLAGQNPQALAAYAQAVSTVNGPSYGKYLSAAQAQARFGPSAEAVASVKAWISSVGLTITSQTPQYIEVSGTVGTTQKAFGTSIHRYATSSGVLDGTTGDIQIPTSLAGAILGVSGINGQVNYDQPALIKQSTLGKSSTGTVKSAAKAAVKPATGDSVDPECSTYYGQNNSADTGLPAGYNGATAIPYSECNWVPSQLREAYGVTASGLTGKGVTVAIVDAYASSTMPADADQYSENHGDAPFAPGQYTQVVTPADWNSEADCGGAAGWAPEESLDIEMVHGLAPDADVEYVGANSCNDDDLLAAIASVVNTHSADIISNSWGEIMHGTTGTGPDSDTITPQEIAAYEQVFQQAAVEGIGVQFSAGDCGDSSPAAAAVGPNCDPTTTEAQANWPDSDPWATSVGGTALYTSSASGRYAFETTMGDNLSLPVVDSTSGAITGWNPFPGVFYFGGGGGTSQDFNEPWYQYGVVPSSLSHTLATGAHSSTAQRVTPDVAMQGDLINATAVGISDGTPYSEAGYGGTSVSSPEWAGMMADADQAIGHSVGFENPLIYFADRFGVFNDVTARAAVAHGTRGVMQEVLDFGSGNVTLWQLGQDTSLVAAPGYDNATGVGTGSAKFLFLMKLLGR
jgi:subtilase family serine protease